MKITFQVDTTEWACQGCGTWKTAQLDDVAYF